MNRTAECKAGLAVLTAHDAYAAELRSKGKLAAAGEVVGRARVAEVLIFKRIDDDDMAQLAAADPAARAVVLRVETHRWWCSAHVLPE